VLEPKYCHGNEKRRVKCTGMDRLRIQPILLGLGIETKKSYYAGLFEVPGGDDKTQFLLSQPESDPSHTETRGTRRQTRARGNRRQTPSNPSHFLFSKHQMDLWWFLSSVRWRGECVSVVVRFNKKTRCSHTSDEWKNGN
jgi:hypothetical protein